MVSRLQILIGIMTKIYPKNKFKGGRDYRNTAKKPSLGSSKGVKSAKYCQVYRLKKRKTFLYIARYVYRPNLLEKTKIFCPNTAR